MGANVTFYLPDELYTYWLKQCVDGKCSNSALFQAWILKDMQKHTETVPQVVQKDIVSEKPLAFSGTKFIKPSKQTVDIKALIKRMKKDE